MDPKDQLVTKLFRIRKTVHEMLKARNYVVSQRELDRDKAQASARRSAAHAPLRFAHARRACVRCSCLLLRVSRRAGRVWRSQPPDACGCIALAVAQFIADFTDTPKREDLTIIAPRMDDPDDLVRPCRGGAAQRGASLPP